MDFLDILSYVLAIFSMFAPPVFVAWMVYKRTKRKNPTPPTGTVSWKIYTYPLLALGLTYAAYYFLLTFLLSGFGGI